MKALEDENQSLKGNSYFVFDIKQPSFWLLEEFFFYIGQPKETIYTILKKFYFKNRKSRSACRATEQQRKWSHSASLCWTILFYYLSFSFSKL